MNFGSSGKNIFYHSNRNVDSSIKVPVNLNASLVPEGIFLSWACGNNVEVTYIIERSSGTSYKPYATSHIKEFLDENIKTGVNYYYRVKAKENNSFSSYSNEVNICKA